MLKYGIMMKCVSAGQSTLCLRIERSHGTQYRQNRPGGIGPAVAWEARGRAGVEGLRLGGDGTPARKGLYHRPRRQGGRTSEHPTRMDLYFCPQPQQAVVMPREPHQRFGVRSQFSQSLNRAIQFEQLLALEIVANQTLDPKDTGYAHSTSDGTHAVP